MAIRAGLHVEEAAGPDCADRRRLIVLHIIQTVASLGASRGGVTRTVSQLAQALAQGRRTRVSIVSADIAAQSDIDVLRTQTAVPGLEVLEPGRSGKSVRQLARESECSQVLVHDNGLWLPSNLWTAVAARRERLPLVISPHGMLEPWALRQQSLRKRAALATYQGWCLRSAQSLHATSSDEAVGIRRVGLRQPIAIVGNGVELPPPALQRTEGQSRGVLFLSRLHPKKGVVELITAWSRIRPTGWSLRIVGPDEGGYRERVAAAIAASGAADSITLHGEVNDATKWQYYAGAELFILPSYSENFGLVIAEALAAGLPVITTNATPWAEIAARGCGWIVEPSVDDIAVALQTATSMPPAKLASMGERGRAWIPQEFSWSQIACKMYELYEWVARGCASPERPSFVHLD